MDNAPSPDLNKQNVAEPAPEALKLQPEGSAAVSPSSQNLTQTISPTDKKRSRSFRPSHKATFISLGVVVIILAINAGILYFVLKQQANSKQLNNGQVTINSAALSKIGVNNTSIGNSGIQLEVGPNAKFNGKVTIAGDVNIGGALSLNSTFNASNANFTQLEAGNTSLGSLDVNGNTTLANLGLRNGIVVTGTSQLQGAVTISQLLTVNNGVNVSGNLAVGGTLSVNNFSASSLTSTSTLTVNGHIITGGLSPTISKGNALGTNGTVAINGDDSAGTLSINIGVNNPAFGTLANVVFHKAFNGIPKVVITPDGVPGNFYIENLSASGFTVSYFEGSFGGDPYSSPANAAGALPQGGFYIDYLVEQ